jgi:hypothetical protein
MPRAASNIMSCWQCPRYSRAERRCRDGKSNPKSKSDSVAVAEALGLRALCHYNPYRDALALRMYFPGHPLAIAASARPKRSSAPRPGNPPETREKTGIQERE